MNPGQILVFVVVIAVVALKILRGPVGEAIADRIARRRLEPDDATQHRLGHLEARLAEVEDRLDFAERLLSRARDSGALKEGTES